ncbi:MAG TPA: DUF5050 domain-containing protein [Bacilli bacterium]|nr:DUF5050 domain-containing protein [Bacilli bacterium]
MYCQSCGKQIAEGEKVCSSCGTVIPLLKEKKVTHQQPSQKNEEKKTSEQKNNKIRLIVLLFLLLLLGFILFFLKAKLIIWIISYIIIAIITVLGWFFGKKNEAAHIIAIMLILILIFISSFVAKKAFPSSTTDNNDNIIDTEEFINSSMVSQGVNKADLGNIISGQYYFSDGKNQYYSTFDESQKAHIYKSSDGGQSGVPIFDGFGWSLVVKDNWLYFSGNEGALIDGTYNLFRIKTDGTGLEKLNSAFCYNMNIYHQWLYYIKRLSMDSPQSDIYRCKLDGSEETLVVSGGVSYFIIFEDNLYYSDISATLYKTNPEGKESVIISLELIDRFIIGNGKIIYTNKDGALKTMDTDGTNGKEIIAVGDNKIGTINSYKNYIYYTEYDTVFNYDLYAFKYRIYSVDFSGNNNKQIYESHSWGFYVNIIDDRLLVLDYVRDDTSKNQIATAQDMSLLGTAHSILYR